MSKKARVMDSCVVLFLFCSYCDYYVNESSGASVDGFEVEKVTSIKKNKEGAGAAKKNKDKKVEKITEHSDGKFQNQSFCIDIVFSLIFECP